MAGLHAPDGSLNITVVDGNTYTGVTAPDGSLNVVVSPGTGPVGAYHPCGAYYVTVSPGTEVPIRAPDGSLYITETSALNSGQRVTVVSGSLEEDLGLPGLPWEGGPSYWSQFSKAASQGWNDPSFFPIAVFLGKADSGHPAALASIGINTLMAAEHQTPVSNVTDHLFLIAQSPESHTDEWTQLEIGNDPKVVGWFISDECEQGLGGCEGAANDAERLALFTGWSQDTAAFNDGRFLCANFGNGVLQTFWAAGTMDDYIDQIDIAGVDKYAYTSPGVRFEIERSPDWPLGDTPANNSMISGAYGWLMDQMSSFQDPVNRKPFWAVIETQMPLLGEDGRSIILYDQIEGAVWNSLIHEARGITYFHHNGFYMTESPGGPNPPAIDPNTGIAPNENTYSLVDGDQALIDAVEAINTKVLSLAPVLNKQTRIWDTGAAAGTMCKVHDGFFYIFACLNPGDATGSKTFNLPPGVNGVTAEVVGEARSVNIVAGEFSDDFANEYTHHVYKISIA